MKTGSLLSKIIIFTAGAAIGSAVTWKLVKVKYEKLADEEIEAVREYYKSCHEENEEDGQENEQENTDTPSTDSPATNKKTAVNHQKRLEELEQMRDVVASMGYASHSDISKCRGDDDMLEPYVITPEEYEDSDYTQVSLTYYEGNDVLEEDLGGIIAKDDIDRLVGTDFASHFGENEYDSDTVFIRNDALRTDYEICRDYGSY